MTKEQANEHLGQGRTLELGKFGKVEIKQLGTEAIPDMLVVGSRISNNTDNPLERMDKDGGKSVQSLIELTLKKSLPEAWKTEPEEVKAVGFRYMMDLLPIILDMNSSNSHESKKKADLLEKAKSLES